MKECDKSSPFLRFPTEVSIAHWSTNRSFCNPDGWVRSSQHDYFFILISKRQKIGKIGYNIFLRMIFSIQVISETCLMTEIRAAGFNDGFSSDRFEILFDKSFAVTIRRLSKYL